MARLRAFQAGQAIFSLIGLHSVRSDVEGDASAASLRKKLGNAFRPIVLNTGLLTYIDRSKRTFPAMGCRADGQPAGQCPPPSPLDPPPTFPPKPQQNVFLSFLSLLKGFRKVSSVGCRFTSNRFSLSTSTAINRDADRKEASSECRFQVKKMKTAGQTD